MKKFKKGDSVRVIIDKVLGKNGHKPNLTIGEEKMVLGIILDSKGNYHLDVGLKSKLNWISSIETGEELLDGDKIHWCHPSRFEHSHIGTEERKKL
tara:strand:- start:1792 stop:2079 length:288 start_codon:yes stop_codon:yes gene_type:complete